MEDAVTEPTIDEPLTEEERQIEGYHKALHSLFSGADDVVVAQSVAVYMGCVMAHSDKWKGLIPGFVAHVMQYANSARAAHIQAETIAVPTVEKDNGNEA